MQIGLILVAGSPRADVELAVWAERAGLDGVFTIEFFNRHGFRISCELRRALL